MSQDEAFVNKSDLWEDYIEQLVWSSQIKIVNIDE